jgi:uncharacterized membrane protein
MISGTVGLIHVLSSVIALITGLFVLVTVKGTRQHRQVGYVYAVAMLLVNGTAFMIYRLYGTFALFHWMAVVSLLTLVAGMVPILRKSGKNYKVVHFQFMYWSVIGLYCAFVAETFSRLPRVVLNENGEPMTVFYKFIGIGTALVMVVAIGFYIKYKPKWVKQFGASK